MQGTQCHGVFISFVISTPHDNACEGAPDFAMLIKITTIEEWVQIPLDIICPCMQYYYHSVRSRPVHMLITSLGEDSCYSPLLLLMLLSARAGSCNH